MEDIDNFFFGKFISKIELFAENHPLIEIHLVSFFFVLSEQSFGVVTLLAEVFEGHSKVFVTEKRRTCVS